MVTKNIIKKKSGSEYFDIRMNYADLLEEIKKPAPNAPEDSSQRVEHSDWSGAKTFTEAVALHEFGYAHAFEKLNLPDLYTPQAQMNTYNDVVGATPDIGAFLSGDPECMLRFEIERAPKKGKIHMVFSSVYHCGISCETAMNYGAAIIDICHSLKNYELKISTAWSVRGIQGSDKKCNAEASIAVLVKDWHDPYIQNKILSFAHPSFLRRLIFKYQEIYPELWSYGYGSVKDTDPKNFEDDAVIMPTLTANASREDLKKMLLKTIADAHQRQKKQLEA